MPTQEEQDLLLEELTAMQLASGATRQQFAQYLGALVRAAYEAELSAVEVGSIVTVGGITTKISAINAQIEKRQDEMDGVVSTKQAAIAALNEQRAELQSQLKTIVGG